jgi:hypothetical protein
MLWVGCANRTRLMANLDSRIRLRILSPLGRYPRHSLRVAGGRLLYEDDLVVAAVEVLPEEAHGLDERHYSELEILCLEEIRFLASMSLSVHPTAGMVYPYPIPSHLDLHIHLDDEEALLQAARTHALSLSADKLSSRGTTLPHAAGGPAYEWQESGFDTGRFADLLRLVSLNDHLLMRGLGALLRADVAWQRAELQEAGPIMLYVALEASFQLVLCTLRGRGIVNPTAVQAGAYVDQAFNPEIDTGGFFVDYYQDRIKALHPSSRFGVFAFAPLQSDDFFFLRDALVQLYGFLITGRVFDPN